MDTLPIFVRDHADGQLFPWKYQVEASKRFGLTLAQIEEVALERGILPARYQRNRTIISVSDQLTLFRSSVAVIGCGGLGGYVVEELARLGVGKIVVIDPDVFEEHNLNRQLFSSPENLDTAKVEAAARRIGEINPAVTLVPVQTAFSPENGAELLAGCQLAVDALDSIQVRLELAEVCTTLNIPLVHGAIAGWFGHVTTQFPGDDSVQAIYRSWTSGKGVEQSLGNPSFTPAVVASLEVAEVCKLLLGRGTPLRGRQAIIDLLSMEMHVINILEGHKETE
ncbi:MAG: thiamine biosynthesis protein ThiF [Geobacteraceae bacterium GWC2_53_11]|nr:MAG: thiamine biosynthesis protein ThiF [Geobacteraceae bacterium GWC2_53_11]